MSNFKDENDIKWELKLSLKTLKMLHSIEDVTKGFDIMKLFQDDSEKELLKIEDPQIFGNVIWQLVMNKDEDTHTLDAFEDGFGGVTLSRAFDAIMDAAINFVPSLQRRKVLEAIKNKAKQGEMIMEKHLEKLTRTIADVDMKSLIQDQLSKNVTSTEAGSE